MPLDVIHGDAVFGLAQRSGIKARAAAIFSSAE
jgi:hypothetical protein